MEKNKPKLLQNSKTQIVTKLKNPNCDKTQKLKLKPNFSKKKSGKNNWPP